MLESEFKSPQREESMGRRRREKAGCALGRDEADGLIGRPRKTWPRWR